MNSKTSDRKRITFKKKKESKVIHNLSQKDQKLMKRGSEKNSRMMWKKVLSDALPG